MKLPAKTQRLLACVGDPSRFRVVVALLAGERCVSDLAGAVGLSQSCTTRHLQALLREGLVRGKRNGKRVMFRLSLENPRIAALIHWAAPPLRRPAPARRSASEGVRRVDEAPVDSCVPGAAGGRKSRVMEPDLTAAVPVGAGVSESGSEAESPDRPDAALDADAPDTPGPRRSTDLEDFLL